MTKTLNDYITTYKEQLEQGDIQIAYTALVKYILRVKSHLSKKAGGEFFFGNASQGYLDYTYFPFFNDYLRSKKLRFGLVLNHKEMRFELWLMGQNAKIQKEYWEALKDTKWNKKRKKMPRYSFIEIILVEHPNFNDLNKLTEAIETETIKTSNEIIDYIKALR